jgi:hypothetical protein
MWSYEQKTGDLYRDGSYEGRGYSGHGAGVNNPALQNVQMVGPIPQGVWDIGTAMEHPHLGPLAMHLAPETGTQTFGRSGFFIHGDNSLMNETGSEGCIVLGRAIRQAIADSGDTRLTVIP